MSASNVRRDDYMSVPIPTYEEAISRPSSSQRFRGPTEISSDAERQHFINGSQMYRQPTVESARNSLDSQASDLSVPDMVHDEQFDRRQLEELDYMEPGAEDGGRGRSYHRARLRSKISQQLSNLSATLGAIRIPSLRRLYAPVPADSENDTPPDPSRGWRSVLNNNISIPEQYRISIPTIARLCALLTIAAFVWFLFAMDIFPRRRMMAMMFDMEDVKAFVQDNLDGLSIAEHLRHLSSYAHEAGSEGNYYMGQWMKNTWEQVGDLDAIELMSYNVLATYPVKQDRQVKLVSPADQEWTAMLEEDHQDGNPTQTLAFHAHSANGQAEGPLIYANAGSRDDFRYLHEHGVTTNGTIALVHQSTTSGAVGLQLRFAQEAGCAGVLVFNGDSFETDQQAWPEGPLPRNDSLHRTNVALSNWVLGDPLTPGYASTKDARKNHELAALALPSIPSLPLSWRDASVLFSRLEGHGQTVPSDWLVPHAYTGNGTTSALDQHNTPPIVQISNNNDVVESQPIYNLHAVIKGTELTEMKIVVGAPRDSWCLGASESASASAVLTELVRIFGLLRKRNWRPLRHLEFVSWDGKIFNSAGSAEFVEDNLDFLRKDGVAYINLEHGVSGPDFTATGSPLLQRTLQHALSRVNIPGSDKTLKEIFDSADDSKITPLQHSSVSSGSASFSHVAGVPSLDMHFSGEQGEWVQGSCYNSMQWMESFGEATSDFGYHKALASVWALVILDLTSEPTIPLDILTYAEAFAKQAATFERDARDYLTTAAPGQTAQDVGLKFGHLQDATIVLAQEADDFHKFPSQWTLRVAAMSGMEDMSMNAERNIYNQRLIQFEKSLIDTQQHKDDGTRAGLKDRPQFKHVLYAPDKWSDGIQTFPTVWEYLEEQQWDKASHELDRVASIVQEAARALNAN